MKLFLVLSISLLMNFNGYCQQFCSEDGTPQDVLIRYFKHVHYEKQVAMYDSLSWCDKLKYFENVTNLPYRKRKKINAVFYDCMLQGLIYQTNYATCEKGHLGYMYDGKTLKHDITVWRKILSCE
ncbi:MAG: hypothetical protein JNM36_13065 [Chitinophagales bacterium]|nr:hypothetical protein [Chitinophagales bacterium]